MYPETDESCAEAFHHVCTGWEIAPDRGQLVQLREFLSMFVRSAGIPRLFPGVLSEWDGISTVTPETIHEASLSRRNGVVENLIVARGYGYP